VSKKLLYILILVTGIADAQIVNIPDANFKAKLIQLGVDTNADGEIQESEAAYPNYLDVSNSNIADLTGIKSFTNIGILNCSFNQLTTLDIANMNNNFNSVYCDHNLLTEIVFENNLIYDLHCRNNQLVDLDCSRLRINGILDLMDNPLQTLNLKNGFNEDFLQLFFSVSLGPLRFICQDENQLVSLNNQLIANGWNNVIANSYCSFTPGGNYNTIAGTVTLDANNNGCDSNDIFQPNIRVNINDGTNQGATFTNNSGNYTFYTQAGSFAITPAIENPTWFTFSPTTATIPFANNNNNTATQNFCISANGIHPDVEIVIAPMFRAIPGFDATYKIVYKNKGNQTLSGNVTFSYFDAVLDFVSATVVPNSQSVGTMSWNYTNLLPFESRSIEIVLNVNAPTETPAVNIGDVLNFSASVNPIAGDEIPSDNTYTYPQTVVGSYDPNDITCLEGDIVAPSEIGNYLHYNIRFENTGTAAAEFVVVKVEVNETDFDMNSLQIMNSSNPVYARINRNIVEFIFQNIQLESGGHGNILLKIKSKNNLQVGDEVNKKADIYFDYNFPILTNDAETVFQSLNNPDFQNDASISVYPNPTNGIVTVNSNNSIKSIQLYDVQGRLLQTNLVNENETTIDVSTKAKGVYFLKILSDKGMKVEKIVRE
jgi:hypothetical protein